MKCPFEMYRIFVIDSEFMGENSDVELRNWLFDQLKMLIISLIVGIPLLGILIKLLSMGQPQYWIYVWLGCVLIGILICEIYPTVLAPLFHNFTPLPEGELRTKIEQLSKSIDFPASQIMCIDGSRTTLNSNAIHMGIGYNTRIVLYDNLIEQLSIDEILAIIAHEISHYKFRHGFKLLLIYLLSMGLYLYFLSLAIYNKEFYQSFGFKDVEVAVGLCLFSYMFKVLKIFNLILT